jgi:DNA-binding response OmpR family regulator
VSKLFQSCPHCGAPTAGQLIEVRGPLQARVANILLRNFERWVSSARLVDAVYAGDPNGGPDFAASSVRVSIKALRTQMRPQGLTIESRHASGWGYRMRATVSQEEDRRVDAV